MPAVGQRRRDRAALLLLIMLVAAVFANAIGGAFVFDDFTDITGNPSARAATFIDRLAVMNRPLTKASYALQDALHGPWAPGFHAANVALHLIAALLAALLLRRAFLLSGRAGHATIAACAIAAIWAVHPALTENVTYVSGRSMLLSSALMLAGLLAASGVIGPANRIIALLCAVLAPLARETALILPAVLLWWQLTVQRDDLRSGIRRLLPVLIGTLFAAAVIFTMPRHQELVAESLRSRPPLGALQGNVHAAFEILSTWFAPWRVTIDPAPPLAWPWDDGRTIAKTALLAGLALTALLLRRRTPVIAFGLGLALLALVPSNSILWRADPVSLKPLYLGGLGLTLATGSLVLVVAGATRHRLALGGAVIVALALGGQTIQRNALFSDEVALWRDATEKTPDYGRPWIMLGYAFFNAGRYAEARDALRRGCDLAPWDSQAAAALSLVEALLARQQTK